MTELEKLKFICKVQQEIINAYRMLEREKELPTDDQTRWQHFLDHAFKRLEEIHKSNIPLKTA